MTKPIDATVLQLGESLTFEDDVTVTRKITDFCDHSYFFRFNPRIFALQIRFVDAKRNRIIIDANPPAGGFKSVGRPLTCWLQ